MHIRIALTAACLLAAAPFVLEAARKNHGKGGFEVWIADQSDTRPGFGGQLVIYEGSASDGQEGRARDADRPARPRRRNRRSVPDGDRQKPRASAHDPRSTTSTRTRCCPSSPADMS